MGHGLHEVLLVALWFLPMSHGVHTDMPVLSANDPAGHTGQPAMPDWFWYAPSGHCVHEADDVLPGWYVPGLQAAHERDTSWKPGPHMAQSPGSVSQATQPGTSPKAEQQLLLRHVVKQTALLVHGPDALSTM